jgi:thiamine transport system permease protein
MRLLTPLLVLVAVLLGLVPLLWFAGEHGGFVLPDAYAWRVTRFTLLQAGLSTLLSVVPAVFAARALARQQFVGKQLLLALFAVPLSLPVIVAVFGLTALFGASGLFSGVLKLYGLPGIVLAHVFFNLPLATRLILQTLEGAAPESHRLAAQLGLTSGQVFRHVDGPLLKQAVPRVAALVFLLCAGSFIIVLVLGGPQATTLEVAIYQSLRMDFDVSRALTLSLIQVVLSGALIILFSNALATSSTHPTLRLAAQRFDGATWSARIGDFAWVLVAALVVVPVLLVIVLGGVFNIQLTSALALASATSLMIALLSTCVALPLAWGMGLAQLRMQRVKNCLQVVGFAGYIVPPAVLATGWFLAFRNVDVGWALPVVLVACMNALMALPFMLAALSPPMAQQLEQQDKLCAQLGLYGWARFTLVDGPALRSPLAQAGLMAFVLSLGDLTALTLLGTEGLVTLPSLVQQQMGRYQSTAAGGTALVLAALCLIFTFTAQRIARWR